jgi:hypothetical protein
MTAVLKAIACTVGIACTTAAIAACSAGSRGSTVSAVGGWTAGPAPSANGKATPGPRALTEPTSQGHPLVGLFAKGFPDSTGPLTTFQQQAGVQPKIVLYFSGWDEALKWSFVKSVTSDGATPLVQIEPGNTPLSSIASGSQDKYLISYAASIRAFGHQVIISFGHEMNGTWYQWGWKNTSPATFVAAWRHIVAVFREQGASNVTWMWTVQAPADAPRNTANPAPWWPGSDYVTWVGIDGHFTHAGETFDDLFDLAIAQVRSITSKPILIGETAIAPIAGQAATIPALFAGVAARGLLGFIYFDSDGNYDYRLQSPTVLAAFRAAAKKYGA